LKFGNELQNRRIIEIAKEKLYLNFLQFIWESTNQETIISPSNNMNKLKELSNNRINWVNRIDKRKSFIINNINLKNSFNGGKNIFNVSDIIIYLIKLKMHFLIKYLIIKIFFFKENNIL
jgi:hypothetical protein